jgi:hypothetical protein
MGAARLTAARTETESPAYAVVTIDGLQPDGDWGRESWLFSEAWWAGSVQPPPSLGLLRWMWTRGPLLIYWHFYLAAVTSQPEKVNDPSREKLGFGFFAYALAALCQCAVSIAILLWAIPIGRWRRALVNAVNKLTLVLGDSYVLLEQDIQRATLVERVRRSLDWLTERADRVAVIAHSQGAAIAHEVLQQTSSQNIRLCVTVGSGLEKLQFLRLVRQSREGVALAGLAVPLGVVSVSAFILAYLGWLDPVLVATGGVAALFAHVFVMHELDRVLGKYRSELLRRASGAALPCQEWIDLHSSHDVVPAHRGSLFEKRHFVTRCEIANERSFLHDHVTYFQPRSAFLPKIWRVLAQRLSTLRLFDESGNVRLEDYESAHGHYALILSFSRFATLTAPFIIDISAKDALYAFGGFIWKSINEDPLSQLFAPLRTLFRIVMSIVGTILPSNFLTVGYVFALVSVAGGAALWWIVFREAWRAHCAARWRMFCCGAGALTERSWKWRHKLNCAALSAAGILPVAVSILFISERAPQLIGDIIKFSLAIPFWMGAVFFAAAAPWASLPTDKPGALPARIFRHGVTFAFYSFLLLFLASVFWHDRQLAEKLSVGILLLLGPAWHIFAAYALRRALDRIWLAVVLAAPLIFTTAFCYTLSWLDMAGFLQERGALGLVPFFTRWELVGFTTYFFATLSVLTIALWTVRQRYAMPATDPRPNTAANSVPEAGAAIGPS